MFFVTAENLLTSKHSSKRLRCQGSCVNVHTLHHTQGGNHSCRVIDQSINCLTSVRQLSFFSTGKPMTMKINASSGFVLTERAANPRRPPPPKKKSVKMHRLFKWPGRGGLPFSAVSFQLPS